MTRFPESPTVTLNARLQAGEHLSTAPPTMPSPSSLRTLQRRACSSRNLPSCRRYASHGHGPQYNEPTGYLFSEKVCRLRCPCSLFLHHLTTTRLLLHALRTEAFARWPEAQEGGLGERLVCWDVRHHGGGDGLALLQARHQVSHGSSISSMFMPTRRL